MFQKDLPNGFTGFANRESGFVSAGDAIRRDEAQHVRPDAAWSGARRRDIFKFAVEKHPDDNLVPQFDPEKLASIPEVDRRWAWVEVDLNAIRSNALAVRSRIKQDTRLLAVVSADAFGHGAALVGKTLVNSGADYLGVSSVDEAIELREAYVNIPILILSEPPCESIPLLLGYKIMPTVYTADFARLYGDAADAFGLSAPFHLKVNTGMNRIGVHDSDVVEFLRQIGLGYHRALTLVGTYTQFATADESEVLGLNMQYRRFYGCLQAMCDAGFAPGILHAANSAAALRFPDLHLDMVRSGVALYGYHPCPETRSIVSLKPAMSVHARIVDVRDVRMTEGVSYGLGYRSAGGAKVCTVPLGYGDGLPRSLSGKISFVAHGKRLPQIGTICMDQCMFEAGVRSWGAPSAVNLNVGDEVVIVGRQDECEASLEELCAISGMIPQELTTGFGRRLSKVYV